VADTVTSASTASAWSRRTFLTRTAGVGAGISLAGAIDSVFGAGTSLAARGGRAAPGYGPLVADPAGRLSLPKGFSYRVVAEAGVTTLDSGEPTPGKQDGTAAFPRGRGKGTVLVMNHEIGTSHAYPVPHHPGLTYDQGALGGTTTIEVDAKGDRVSEYVSLAGTMVNCAGGQTPWDTWLSCEESEALPTPTNGLQKRHGYVFEVDPYDSEANQDPQPILALGRYAHEALAVDPRTQRIYLTEDAANPNGLVYRFTPPRSRGRMRRGSLARLGVDAGDYEAMRAFDDHGVFVPDLSVAQVGTTYDVEWVTVPDRDATSVSTRKQFNVPGGTGAPGGDITRSRKLEGAWWGDGGFYFVSSYARFTDGSAAQHDGQVWFHDPKDETVTLVLQFAFTPADQDGDPDGPDNITVSPFGGVILAEDGEGKQHLVGADDRGKAFFFARNEHPDDAEFAGPTFSPDKKILFANVQDPGIVFAIYGPWRKGDGRDDD
jgi:secreted PhoX family phosphatase